MSRQPVALLGLSANPAHQGHLAISQALKQKGFSEVWWSITPEQEFKPANTLAPYPHRKALAQLLTQPHQSWLKLSDFEANLPIQSEHHRTAEFLASLSQAHPQNHFHFVMGADSWAHPHKGFHTWGGYQNISTISPLLIIPREPFSTADLTTCPAAQTLPAASWSILPMPHHPVSATTIRENLMTNTPPNGLTAPQMSYIARHQLYLPNAAHSR